MAEEMNIEDRTRMPPLVRAKGLSKTYRVFDRPLDRLLQALPGNTKLYYRPRTALTDVSFDILPGEAFGVIGRNGAGKSTLLQILAGVLTPSAGEVSAPQRLLAMLELGSGFNPKLTGRQNAMLNGIILGLTRAETAARMKAIAAFADIGDYFDEPVRTYSSGMFLRLAFAVTTGLTPQALLVDEALAVGDVFFRQKCHARMNEILGGGACVILVSHALSEVAEFCHRALLLDRGRVEFLGDAGEAVKRYMVVPGRVFDLAPLAPPPQTVPELPGADELPWPEPGEFVDLSRASLADNGQSLCLGVALCGEDLKARNGFFQGETAFVFAAYRMLAPIEVPVAGAEFADSRGIIVFGKNTLQYDCPVPLYVPAGTVLRFAYEVRLDLAPGEYTVNVGLTAIPRGAYENRENLTHQAMDEQTTVLSVLSGVASLTLSMRPLGTRPVQLTHHGTANLQSRAVCLAQSPAPETRP